MKGSAWWKTSKNGLQYKSGEITINNQKYWISIFENKKKEPGSKQPDFNIVLNLPQQQQSPQQQYQQPQQFNQQPAQQQPSVGQQNAQTVQQNFVNDPYAPPQQQMVDDPWNDNGAPF
jgi:hypothetical protein